MSRHFLTCLGLGLIFFSCGPGLRTVESPAIDITSPTEGASVSALSQVYSGTCDPRWIIVVQYGSNVSGPSTATCADGQFSFTAQYAAVAGTRAVTVSQTDTLGNVGQVTRSVQYVRTPFALAGGFNAGVKSLLMTTDGTGSAYVGGSFTAYKGVSAGKLARLDGSGNMDATFVTTVGFNGDVNALALGTDGTGDLFIGGAFTDFNGTTLNRVARLTSAGLINSGFLTGTGFDAAVKSIVPVGDGTADIYVGGSFTKYNSGVANAVKMVRLTATGGNNSAVFNASALTFDADVNAIVPVNDGSGDVYVGGAFSLPSAGLVRLTTAGAVNGSLNVGAGFNGAVNAILPIPDGSGDIYVAGAFTSYQGSAVGRVVRLQATGTVSGTFNPGTAFNAKVSALALSDLTGTFYAVGSFTSYAGSTVNEIVRIRPTGSLDVSLTVGTGFNGPLTSISVVNDGTADLLLGGAFSAVNTYGMNDLVRVSSAGLVNTSYNSGAGFNAAVLAVTPTLDNSGDVYVGGSFTYYNGTAANRIARITSGGALVTAFANGTGFNADVAVILNTDDGSGDVIVGGNFSTYNGSGVGRLVRLTSSGAVNSTLATNPGFAGGNVTALLLSPDGSGNLYVGGSFTTYQGVAYPGIVRLTALGVADIGFTPAAGFDAAVTCLSAVGATSTDILVGGAFQTYRGAGAKRLVRLTASGVASGTLSTGLGFDDTVNAITVSSDASTVFVGGAFRNYNGIAAGSLIAIRPNGNVVTAFNVASGTGFDATVNTIQPLLDGTGDLIVGGQFLAYNGLSALGLARITSAGLRNTVFDAGTGFNGTVDQAVPAVDGSGDIYVGGTFSVFQPSSTATDTMARLSSAGSID